MIGLEEIIKINNMSVTDLAKELNIARGNIYNWFNGKRNIPQKILIKLSEIFNLPEEYFVKELTEIERIKVRTSQIEGLVANPSVYYENEVNIYKLKVIAKIADRLKETLEDNGLNYIEEIFESLIDIISSKKFSQKVLKDILGAVIISYGGIENDKNNEFINNLVELIDENEKKRQMKKKEIEQLIQSVDIEDLFK